MSDLNSLNLQQLEPFAMDITFSVEEVRLALSKTKSSKSPGMNEIN